LKQDSKGELNKNYNENYKALNQTIINLKQNMGIIKMCLEESKQFNNSKLVIETIDLTFCKDIIRNSQNNIEFKLLNKIEENISSLEEKLKTIKTSVIIGEHKHYITSMISLPDGYIATASWDKTIKIWDLSKNILIKTLEGHASFIYCLTLLSDGNIASGSMETIKIWEGKNDYQCIYTLVGIQILLDVY
jgi:WD40 repeat protein